jgi:putative ABC transport system substrate-binding protein
MVIRAAIMIVVAFGLLAVPFAAAAEQAQMYRIGILATANPRSTVFYQAFEQRLSELGFVEGKNTVFEYRDAEGKLDRLPRLAADLVRINVNVIIVASDDATRVAKEATSTIPIVMVAVNFDPLAQTYIASFARPGRNITGVYFLPWELTGKRLELFKEMFPTMHRVAVLSDPITAEQVKKVDVANRSVGFKLQRVDLRNPPDFKEAFQTAVRSNAEGLFALESAVIYRGRKEIAELALKNGLPTSFAFREYVDAGGLVSYGASFPNMFRRVAEYTERILRGAKAADLPVEQPTKFQLVINMKTAKALGLTVPPSLLVRADEVIE